MAGGIAKQGAGMDEKRCLNELLELKTAVARIEEQLRSVWKILREDREGERRSIERAMDRLDQVVNRQQNLRARIAAMEEFINQARDLKRSVVFPIIVAIIMSGLSVTGGLILFMLRFGVRGY